MGGINTGDTAFVLICAALVALMTPGLAFFYGGLVRRKNFLAIMMQSFISMGVVTTIWVFFGYSLAFSGDIGGVFGNLHWAMLTGVAHLPGPWAPNIPAQAHFVYQEMFAIITPALITGAFADRVKFKSYLWFLVLWSVFVYIPFVHWIWGGGWLAQHGVLDFAGGLVVHVSAGFAALASVFVVGRRKFGKGERGLPHNLAFVALGTGISGRAICRSGGAAGEFGAGATLGRSLAGRVSGVNGRGSTRGSSADFSGIAGGAGASGLALRASGRGTGAALSFA